MAMNDDLVFCVLMKKRKILKINIEIVRRLMIMPDESLRLVVGGSGDDEPVSHQVKGCTGRAH
jgi:hypothetical protein